MKRWPTLASAPVTLTSPSKASVVASPSDVSEITLRMPNVHYLPIDLSAFGQDARGKVFLPTDEPSGQIEVTLRRG